MGIPVLSHHRTQPVAVPIQVVGYLPNVLGDVLLRIELFLDVHVEVVEPVISQLHHIDVVHLVARLARLFVPNGIRDQGAYRR